MNGWVLWVIAAAAFGIGEMLTTGFVLAPFSIAAALAAVIDAGAGGLAAWIVFIGAALLALVLVRPVVRAYLKVPPGLRTGAAAPVAKQAVVLERIANREGVGCVRIDGEVWTARSLFDDQVIEPGTVVDVVEIRGTMALVSEAKGHMAARVLSA
jgi:membrane protein implicated in regulation of membrane protease activity